MALAFSQTASVFVFPPPLCSSPLPLPPHTHYPPPPRTEVFSSAEKFEEWFSLGDGGAEKEAEVVQQLHKV